MAGLMEQVCVCAQGSYFEGDQVSVAVCPTITVQYHHSANFFAAPRIYSIRIFIVQAPILLFTNAHYSSSILAWHKIFTHCKSCNKQDVNVEHSANIKDAKENVAHNCKCGLLSLAPVSAGFLLGLVFDLKMEVVCSSKTSGFL
jgi:hypothetical protein